MGHAMAPRARYCQQTKSFSHDNYTVFRCSIVPISSAVEQVEYGKLNMGTLVVLTSLAGFS